MKDLDFLIPLMVVVFLSLMVAGLVYTEHQNLEAYKVCITLHKPSECKR